MNQGWIKLHRSLLDNWLFTKTKRHSHVDAWVYMLFRANHKDTKISFDNDIIIVKRGSFITSMRKMSKILGWNVKTFRSFLNLLKADQMVDYSSDQRKTLITIINYEKYQAYDKPTADQSPDQSREHWPDQSGNTPGTLSGHRERMIKNDNNVKETHSRFGGSDFPTPWRTLTLNDMQVDQALVAFKQYGLDSADLPLAINELKRHYENNPQKWKNGAGIAMDITSAWLMTKLNVARKTVPEERRPMKKFIPDEDEDNYES